MLEKQNNRNDDTEPIENQFKCVFSRVYQLLPEPERMLLELVVTIGAGLIVSVLLGVALKCNENYKIQQQFRKKMKGIAFIPNSSLFLGNLNLIALHERNWLKAHKLLEENGGLMAGFYANKPVIVTTDLDLIKTMVIDEPNDHINRIKMNLPINEFDVDSIAFVENDQWRRLRKAIAPAFS